MAQLKRVASLVILIAGFGIYLPANDLTSQKTAARLHAAEKFSQFSVVGGFWRTDGSYTSSLSLSNADQTQPSDVTPVLVTANGVATDLNSIHLNPGGTATSR